MTLKTPTGVIGVLTLAVGLGGMSHLSSHWCFHPLQRGLTKPVLAMELLRNVDDVSYVLGTKCQNCSTCPHPVFGNREEMRVQQFIDFAFIPLYTLFLLGAAAASRKPKENNEARPRFVRFLAIVAAICAISGAISDFVEDWRILGALDEHTLLNDVAAAAIRAAAYTKWAILFGSVLCLTPVFWDRSIRSILLKSIGGLTVAMSLLAGSSGLHACWYRDDKSLQASAGLMFAVFVFATTYFLLFMKFRKGTLAAFDDIAETKAIRNLRVGPDGRRL